MPRKDPEARRAYMKARYWAKREELLAKNKAWRDAHLDEIHAYQKQWRAENKAYLLEYGRNYREINRAVVRAYNRLRYATMPSVRAAKKAYHAIHREERALKQRKYNATTRPQRNARSRARWATDATYRARVKESKQRWEQRCPEVKQSGQQQWNTAHPESLRMYLERRRAALASAAINDFTAAQWKAKKAAYDYRCVYCHRKMQSLTMDHIIPLSQGGNHTWDNIVPACQSCNSKKWIHEPAIPIQITFNF